MSKAEERFRHYEKLVKKAGDQAPASCRKCPYGSKLKVFDVEIPRSVRAAEISAEGKSMVSSPEKSRKEKLRPRNDLRRT